MFLKPRLKSRLYLTAILIAGFVMASAALAAPVIEHEELSTLTDNLAIITWVTTDPATTVVEYGIAGFSQASSEAALINNHYAVLQNLYPNTTYQYRVKSVAGDSSSVVGATKYFTTLDPPSGALLFTFATLADPQYGMGKADTGGARGRPYSKSKEILDATVQTINSFVPSFTIIKGDVIESSGGTYGEYVNTTKIPPENTKTIKEYFDTLTNAYYPLPGNHDKELPAYIGGNASSWYDKNLHPLYSGITVADPTQNSCFNYAFDYPAATPLYRYIILDSVRSDIKSYVDTTYLQTQLASAESLGLKCFIFLHHPVTDIRTEGIPEVVLEEVTGSSPVDYDLIQPSNLTDVQNLITTYKDTIAGVFSGHIHDNHYAEVSGVPCVRTAAGLQFPCGFNYYKVYTNGYIQSFIKVPYYTEVAREVVTPEAGYSDTYWEQFSLGPVSARNFSHTLSAAAPYVARTSPASSETGVATNSIIRITFTKAMLQTDTQNAITFTPTPSSVTYSWDAMGTILTINHSGLSASTGYTITVSAGAKDLSRQGILAPYQFSFTSGTGADSTPPAAAFDRLTNDTTTDPRPVFTGLATASGAAITNIQCRVDGGSWTDATPLDGAFNSASEAFIFRVTSSLTRRPTAHDIEVRCYDAAGNVNTSFALYSFYVIGERPEVQLTSHNTPLVDGDAIESTPSFEVTAVTNKGINFIRGRMNNGTPSNLTVIQDPAYPLVYHANFSPTLTDGTYSLKVEVEDLDGNMTTSEVTNLLVQSAAPLQVESQPLNFPNPFTDPGAGTTAIAYKLSKSADITLTLHDLMGNQIYKQTFPARTPGGSAGYNEVTWNGTASGGGVVGNGIYVYLIIGEGKILGKGKLTVLK